MAEPKLVTHSISALGFNHKDLEFSFCPKKNSCIFSIILTKEIKFKDTFLHLEKYQNRYAFMKSEMEINHVRQLTGLLRRNVHSACWRKPGGKRMRMDVSGAARERAAHAASAEASESNSFFMWKLNRDSEQTTPTAECTEILTSLLWWIGSRATRYLIGLCTNTLGASSVIHPSCRAAVNLVWIFHRKIQAGIKVNRHWNPAKTPNTGPAPQTHFHPEISREVPLISSLRHICWL